MSWGVHKTQSPLDGSDVLAHEQDDSESMEEKWEEAKRWRWVEKCAALRYRVLIDFPSALQWRFSANIFRYNARREGLIS